MVWRRSRSLRLALFAVVLLAYGLPAAPPAATQPATPAGPEQSLVTQARLNAVPLGQAATVGPLEIVVTGYDQDATDLLVEAESSGPPGWSNERIVRIDMTITNVGDTDVEFGREFPLDLRFAGNRGVILVPRSLSRTCVDEQEFNVSSTPPLPPGASRDVIVCDAVLAADASSLQMLVIDPAPSDAGVPFTAEIASGSWFDLGAPRPYDPGVAAEQVRVARAVAPDSPASWEAPATGVTTTGNVVAEWLDYRPDVTAVVSGDEGWQHAAPDPGRQWVFASLRLTNVGDRPASVRVFLVGADGVGRDLSVHSRAFEHEGHLLLPGGSALWAGQWEMPSSDTSRALAVVAGDAPGAAATWLNADSASPFAWDAPEMALADPAETTDPALAVAPGETAAVGDFNVSIARVPESDTERSIAYSVSATLAATPNGEAALTTWYLDASMATGLCFPGGGVLLFLPGGAAQMGVNCNVDGDATVPLSINVATWATGEESTGLFAREPEP